MLWTQPAVAKINLDKATIDFISVLAVDLAWPDFAITAYHEQLIEAVPRGWEPILLRKKTLIFSLRQVWIRREQAYPYLRGCRTTILRDSV